MLLRLFNRPACTAINYGGGGRKIQNMKLRGEIIIRFKEDGSIDWFCDGNDAQLATLLNEVSKRCKELHNGVLIAGKKIHSDLAKSEYYAPKGEA